MNAECRSVSETLKTGVCILCRVTVDTRCYHPSYCKDIVFMRLLSISCWVFILERKVFKRAKIYYLCHLIMKCFVYLPETVITMTLQSLQGFNGIKSSSPMTFLVYIMLLVVSAILMWDLIRPQMILTSFFSDHTFLVTTC